MSETAVIDGANVALQEKSSGGKGKVSSLIKIRRILKDKGYRTIIIADASLRYDIDERQQYDDLERQGVVYQAPAGTEADYFVLKTAELEDAIVISNDRYDKYQAQFPWIRDRRIPFMVVDGNVILHCPEVSENHHARHNRSGRDQH